MTNKKQIIPVENIQNLIFTIRGEQVILDRDLAKLYQVETKVLNQAVKRNLNRFPDNFRFQLTEVELNNLRSQIVTLENDTNPLRSQSVTLKNKRWQHSKYLPYAFTEQGVAMLSAVLRSDTAVKVSVQIMQAFVEMKRFIRNNAGIFQRLNEIEHKQIETDKKFEKVFKALEEKIQQPNQGIFYDG